MTGAAQSPAVPTGALMVVATRLKEYAGEVFKQRKPWTEVVDKNAFSKPQNLSEVRPAQRRGSAMPGVHCPHGAHAPRPPQATTRLRKNLAYFRVNYMIVVLLTLIITFVTNPESLFIVGLLLAGWSYVFVIRQQPLVINGRQLRWAASPRPPCRSRAA